MTHFTPELGGSEPMYIQIADQIGQALIRGTLCDGDLLPSIRDLAARIGINVSTVTRAYREAERRGLISGTTGSGTYVTGGAAERSSIAFPGPYAPGMTEMGIVSPLPHLDPDLSSALRALSRRKNLTAFMNYHSPEGFPQHREAGRIWMKRCKAEYTAEDIVICSGSQHALACVLMSHFRDGDRIAADELTYPGFKTAAAMLRIKLIPVRMDAKGMIPGELETACRREKIKGLFLMPSMQNPQPDSLTIAEEMRSHSSPKNTVLWSLKTTPIFIFRSPRACRSRRAFRRTPSLLPEYPRPWGRDSGFRSSRRKNPEGKKYPAP